MAERSREKSPRPLRLSGSVAMVYTCSGRAGMPVRVLSTLLVVVDMVVAVGDYQQKALSGSRFHVFAKTSAAMWNGAR
eukprot:1654055-Ditylum_brightwellii.AAC.1